VRWLFALAVLFLGGCGQFEGYSSSPYRDPVSESTVCHGHKVLRGQHREYTEQECGAFYLVDVGSAALAVARCARPATVGQLVAFTDLAYNIGQGTFCKSSVSRLSRQNRIIESCKALRSYTFAKGKRLRGLVSRRNYFSDYCLSDFRPVP
jgi:lysozyme